MRLPVNTARNSVLAGKNGCSRIHRRCVGHHLSVRADYSRKLNLAKSEPFPVAVHRDSTADRLCDAATVTGEYMLPPFARYSPHLGQTLLASSRHFLLSWQQHQEFFKRGFLADPFARAQCEYTPEHICSIESKTWCTVEVHIGYAQQPSVFHVA